MCTRPVILPRPGVPCHRWDLYKNIRPSIDKIIVPCGKCPDCLKRRQKDIAGRCVIEANARGSMHFLTLTYAEDKLPVSVVFEVISKESGELLNRSYSPRVVSSRDNNFDRFSLSEAHSLLEKVKPSFKPRYSQVVLFEDDKILIQHSITPSLCRADVRLWLKASRVAYERKYGEKLNFSYIACGEYGPNTNRPHYHLAIFGLNDKQAYFLSERWKSRYGFYFLEKVNAVNPDGSSGFERASKYVAKYVAKGCFECLSVKDCRAEKPRLCCSIAKKCGLGDAFLTSDLIDYFRCKDLFPNLDIMDVSSVSDLALLAKEVQKRSLVTYSGFSFPLPRKFVQKLWYFYDSVSETYVSSPLRYAYSDFIQFNLFRDYRQKFADSAPGLFGADSLLYGQEETSPQNYSLSEKKSLAVLASQYKKSIY